MPLDLNCFHQALDHYSRGEHAEALAVLAPFLGGPNADPDALDLAAACEYAMNRLERAEACWQRAIAGHPHHAGAHNNLGNLYERLGRLPEAEAMYRRSLDLRDDSPDGHYNLGNVLARQDRLADAERSLRRALELRPAFALAHYNLAKLLMPQKRFDEARTHFQFAIDARPDWADAHSNLGDAFAAQQRPDDAERAYRAAIELNPRLTNAYQRLAELLETFDRLADLERLYRRLADCVPEMSAAHFNLGQVIYRATAVAGLERLDEAEAAYRRAIALQPDYTQAYLSLGDLLREHPERMNDMLATLRRAVEIDPHAAEARLHLSGGLLRAGAYTEAWPLLEARYDESWPQRPIPTPDLPFPRWQGEPLGGKSLLVVHEQGFGDTFQFCRYLPLLKSLGCSRLSVVWSLQDALLASIDGVDACVNVDALHTLPPHDYWCFLMSLPLLLGAAGEVIPNVTPYLAADEQRIEYWRSRLPADVPKVGVAALPEPRPSPLDVRRWISAQACVPFLGVPGVRFVNLQKASVARAQFDALPPHLRPLDLMDDVRDFSDTAAIISSLDLVIAADTSVAHLAGALGKPVWILLHTKPCWRWLVNRDDSPWYPNARLFRQTVPNQWDDVIERVADALADWRASN